LARIFKPDDLGCKSVSTRTRGDYTRSWGAYIPTKTVGTYAPPAAEGIREKQIRTIGIKEAFSEQLSLLQVQAEGVRPEVQDALCFTAAKQFLDFFADCVGKRLEERIRQGDDSSPKGFQLNRSRDLLKDDHEILIAQLDDVKSNGYAYFETAAANKAAREIASAESAVK